MVLIFDIGNTSITAGLFRGSRMIGSFRMPSRKGARASFYESLVKKNIRKIRAFEISGCLIGSVVPPLTRVLANSVKKVTGVNPLFITPKTKFNFKNLYRKKSDVGDDRLANAAAGISAYPGKNLIIIDFGTTITFDVITKKGEYKGGVIMPGLNLSREILYERAARLPSVEMKYPEKVIGNNTVNAIQSGVINSAIAGINCLIKRIRKELKDNRAKVILTGGEVDKKILKMIDAAPAAVDHDFTLKGFKLIYDLNKSIQTKGRA